MGLSKLFKNKQQPAEKKVKVGDYSLTANFEHPIEEYLNHYPYYSRNLPRIAKYIEDKYPTYTIIDVGANIGDSAALLRSVNVKQFVHLIEGDPAYLKLVKENLSLFTDVKLHETFLGTETKTIQLEIDNAEGTAKINVGSGTSVEVIKLDDLVEKERIENIKLLKTDTDGFDFNILRGSFETIKKNKPVLFFEYDAMLLKLQDDDGLSIFADLASFGYQTALYYDNFGKLLLSTPISNHQLIKQLHAYLNRGESAFPYYDVCLLHSDDQDLAENIIGKEMEFFK